MQIQKGLVKYKDRSDIVCTYGLTEDGKQYYFLDGNSIANGNIVASTVLVEAIDPVVSASSVGVIDPNGNVVIPFENKSIKAISDSLLLVEKANSTTPSVVEAIGLRSDPLAATKLVTTPATIKDKMNAKMGSEGRFIFNDQFSEATICDVNGNNIIDDQYFSFIGMKNNEALYFSKNTVDSPVMEFSLTDKMFIVPEEPANPTALDVENTAVSQDIIDGAMVAVEEQNHEFGEGDITAKDFENNVEVSSNNLVVGGAPVEEPLPVEPSVVDPNIPVEAVQEVASEMPVDENNTLEDDNEEEPESVIPDVKSVSEDIPTSLEAVNDDSNNQEEDAININEAVDKSFGEEENTVEETAMDSEKEVVDTSNVENIPLEENAVGEEVVNESTSTEEPIVNTEVVATEEKINDSVSDNTDEVATDDKLMSFDFGDNINYSDSSSNVVEKDTQVEDVVSEFKNDLFDVDLDADIFADSTLHADKIDVEDNFDYGYKTFSTKDTIIEDVAATMTNLISLNRTQRQKIISYEEKFEQAALAHKKIVEKAKSQIREIESLKGKLKNYETIVTKLESKITLLENKVHDQDKVIASQTRELEALRPQVEGKEELARILADAQSLLDQE